MSKTFIWVSRHNLTETQIEHANLLTGNGTIIEYGDVDAFNPIEVDRLYQFLDQIGRDNVVVGVVHAGLSARLVKRCYDVAVARNINRAPEGERPQFVFERWDVIRGCGKG